MQGGLGRKKLLYSLRLWQTEATSMKDAVRGVDLRGPRPERTRGVVCLHNV